MNAAEIIREGRNQLFERGWYQGELISEDGTVCALGALGIAAHGEDRLVKQGYSLFSFACVTELSEAVDLLVAAVDEKRHALSDDALDRIYYFNDEDARTFSEVIDVFDRAEKIAESGGVGGVS